MTIFQESILHYLVVCRCLSSALDIYFFICVTLTNFSTCSPQIPGPDGFKTKLNENTLLYLRSIKRCCLLFRRICDLRSFFEVWDSWRPSVCCQSKSIWGFTVLTSNPWSFLQNGEASWFRTSPKCEMVVRIFVLTQTMINQLVYFLYTIGSVLQLSMQPKSSTCSCRSEDQDGWGDERNQCSDSTSDVSSGRALWWI